MTETKTIENYLQYLRAKLRGKTPLVATEDIVATPEGIVAKLGESIDAVQYRNLSRLTLDKPLENCIAVTDVLTPSTIYQHINEIIDNEPSFNPIDVAFGTHSVLEECCNHLRQYPALLEIFTILKIEAEALFEQSLLSAYFAYIVGIAAKFSEEKIEAAFLSGLFHDIGLLFINRSHLLDKEKKLTAQEWQNMQLHPIISFKLLKCIDGFPHDSCRASLEHHERPDGSGYPLEKNAKDISELGSLISLLDDVVVIYIKRFRPLKRSIKGLLPVVQMNLFGYDSSAVSAVTQALKHAPEPTIESINKTVVKKLIEYTYQQQLYINEIMNVIKQANELIGFEHGDKAVSDIQNLGTKISSVIASSGLQEAPYVELLQRLQEEDHQVLHLEVEQVRLMLEEIIYQLQSYYKATNIYCHQQNTGLSKKMNIIADIFSATEKPPKPQEIVQYWQQISH